jgi:hypothetical protein
LDKSRIAESGEKRDNKNLSGILLFLFYFSTMQKIEFLARDSNPKLETSVKIRNRRRSLQQGCQMVYVSSYQKFQFGYIFESLVMENAGIYGHS